MGDSESQREDAKREDWEDKHGVGGSDPYSRECPLCQGTLYLAERYAATRVDPACERWACACGHEEGG